MSFLDNLENNLKSLESSEQGKEDAERAQRRASRNALTRRPWPLWPKSSNRVRIQRNCSSRPRAWDSPCDESTHCVAGDHAAAGGPRKRLELRPTAKGIVAAYLEDGHGTRVEPVD